MKRRSIGCIILALLCFAGYAAGEPVRLFVGQDLAAVGGLPGYAEGYVDTFGMPDGVTTYTGLPMLAGLLAPADWGAGDVCAQAYVEDEAFAGVDMAIGLYMAGYTGQIGAGLYKNAIERLGRFILRSGRVVYLRIGYEFDGEWNGYEPAQYIRAFRAIVDTLREMGVENVQTVWQSSGSGGADHLLQWYPGDDYVDWMGYSCFNGPAALTGRGILMLARERGKPVFVCEAAPRRDNKLADAETLWAGWYAPFLRHIEANSDIIGAVGYINCDWESQRMWRGQGWGDSRLQINERLADMWRETLASGLFGEWQ